MTQSKYPYDDTHQCLVMVHAGSFTIVYPDREELDQTECRPDRETIWDILHQDDGMIASGSSCCPRHAFQEARKLVDQHESELEQKALGKPIRISEADRRNRMTNRLANRQERTSGTPVTQADPRG